MPKIHPTADIAPDASLADDVQIGAFSVVESGVHIGPGSVLGHHVVVRARSQLGSSVRVDDHASIGKQPMRSPNSAVTTAQEQEPAVIGDRCLIGSGAVIYAGARLEDRVLVADLATVREQVTIGRKTIVGRGVAIENQCTIGRFCKLETNAYITAYSTIEDRVFIAPGVRTSNDNFLGRTEDRFKHFAGVHVCRGGRIGVGAVILPGRTVGEDALIAAGAILTVDAEPRTVYVGIPARATRPVPTEQLLDQQGWSDD